MTTSSQTQRSRAARRRAPRRRSPARLTALIVLTALCLAALLLIGLRMARAGVLPGIVVDGVHVGGLTEPELRAEIEQLGRRKGDAVVVATVTDQDGGSDAGFTGRAGDVGYRLDVDATVEAVLARGRQGNVLAAFADHIRAFAATTKLEAVENVDEAMLDEWVQEASDRLAEEPREGRLRFNGAQIEPVYPEPGAAVVTDALATAVRDRLLDGSGGTVVAEVEPVDPVTTDADVNAVLDDARRALAEAVVLRRDDNQITLDSDDLGRVLSTRLAEQGSLELRVGPKKLTEVIGVDTIAALEAEPQSATIELVSGEPVIRKGREGFSYDAKTAAAQLQRILTDDEDRDAVLEGDVVEPEVTTKEVRQLRVVERVSSFTTEHACCESRVTNIHRIADMIDGQLILPGDTFSVNGFVGERTEAKGFVAGGAIFEGEFVEQIGGGVSQFATTMYNAAWFGGYDIPEHKAHSYYISRYPEGREATLNYPDVDLKVRNNSPYGLLIDTSYTDTSITVTFWGKEWVDVESVTGPRRNVKPPGTQYRENDQLDEGEEREIQAAGGPGFDVTVTRTLTFPGGRTERDEVTTTYLPQDRIVERNS